MLKRSIVFISISIILFLGCGPGEVTLETMDPLLVKDYMNAQKAYLGHNLKQAEEGFRSISERQHNFYQARFMLGKTHYLKGGFAEAEKIFKELLADYPQYYEANMWLARTELSLGKKAEAEARIKKLLSINSSDPRLLVLLAKINKENNDIKSALANLQEAVLYEEEVAYTHLELGKIFYQFEINDKALNELQICLLMLSENNIMRKAVTELIDKIKGASHEAPKSGK
jgi:tetratricopeptide (TPR) repeat protein